MPKKIYTIPQFKTVAGNVYAIVDVYKSKPAADAKAKANRVAGYKTNVVKIARKAEYASTPYHRTAFDAPSYAVYSDFSGW